MCACSIPAPARASPSRRSLMPCARWGPLRLRPCGEDTPGVELAQDRADKAAHVLDHVIAGDWAEVTVRSEAFSLLWLNPSYDHEAGNADERKDRQEVI